MSRFLLYTQSPPLLIKLSHSVKLGLTDPITEDASPFFLPSCLLQMFWQAMTVEYVIAKDQHTTLRADELSADNECLCQAIRSRLHFVAYLYAPLMSVLEQLLE